MLRDRAGLGEAVERELLVVRVQRRPSGAPTRDHGRGARRRLLDVGTDAVVLELIRDAQGARRVHGSASPYGIVDLVRRGASASACLREAQGPAAPGRDLSLSRLRSLRRRKEQRWRRSCRQRSITGSTGRWRSSATAARATPMRSTCTTRCPGAFGLREVVLVGGGRGAGSSADDPGRGPRCTARLAAPPRPGAAAGVHGVRPAVARALCGRVVRARVQRPLRACRPRRRARRRDGRPQGPWPRRPAPVHRRLRNPGAHRRRAGRVRGLRGTSRSPTPSESAPPARGSSKRPSARRPRPTCSASRPSSAAAPPS